MPSVPLLLLRVCIPTANTWVVNERNRGGDVDTRDCRPVVDFDDDDWWQSTLHGHVLQNKGSQGQDGPVWCAQRVLSLQPQLRDACPSKPTPTGRPVPVGEVGRAPLFVYYRCRE